MKNSKIDMLICAMFLMVFIAAPLKTACAESGLEVQKQLQGGQPGANVFNGPVQTNVPLGNAPQGNGVDPNCFQSKSSNPDCGKTVDPYKPEAGPLTLLNCGGGEISVKTFNSNDGVMWVAYKEIAIAPRYYKKLVCATSRCKLIVGSLKTGALTGFQVYKGGRIRPTNREAMMNFGCQIYK